MGEIGEDPGVPNWIDSLLPAMADHVHTLIRGEILNSAARKFVINKILTN